MEGIVRRILAEPDRDKESRLAQEHIAIAVLGKTVYVSRNTYKSHPSAVALRRDGFVVIGTHAELGCLAQVPRQSRHLVSVYVTRKRPNGKLAFSKPCGACQTYLHNQNINPKNVWYTDNDGNWLQLGTYQNLEEVNARLTD